MALTLTLTANTGFATTNTTTNIKDQTSGQTDQFDGQILDNKTLNNSVEENTPQENLQTPAYMAAGSPEIADLSTETITDSTEVNFDRAQINNAATKVKTFVNKKNRLPSHVYIGKYQVTMPQLLKLMTQNLININNGISSSITLSTVKNPLSAKETVKTGTITKKEYINIADKINRHIDSYSKAPDRTYIPLGYIKFENLVYSYSRVLNFNELYNRLPNTLTVRAWTGASYKPTSTVSAGSSTVTSGNQSSDSSNTSEDNTSTPSEGPTSSNVSFTSAQINNAATKLKTFVDKNSRLPNQLYIGDFQLTMPQLLKLITQNLININNGISSSITLNTVNTQSSATETVKTGSITKTEYMKIAERINSFIDKYNKAPGKTYITLGYIKFDNLVYTYSKILNFQEVNNRLPNTVSIKSWNSIKASGSSSSSSSLSQYLAATKNAQSTSSTIINKAKSITSGLTSTYSKAAAIFNWVKNNITYSFYYDSKKGALGTLSSRTANCCDTSHLVVALARAVGIPARYQHGTCKFSSGTYGHVWAQLYVDGKWYYADAVSKSNSLGTIKNWNLSSYKLHGTYASLPF